MATYLAEQVHLCRGFVAQGALGPPWLATQPAGVLWPRPHNGRFDFAASAPGAEWIDELATAARDRLSEAAGEVVVAHSDWRTEHVRFERREIVSTYDWQSLAVGTEPALIGQIGHTFTVDLGIEQRRRRPTLAGFSAFVADYESARCRSFTGAERKAIDAAWVYAIAYGARCEHSDLVLIWNLPKADIAQDSFTGLLARHGAQLLG